MQGRAALQGEEGHVFLLHQGLHIHPGHTHALAEHVGLLVDAVVENLHAQVGHGDLIGIGEAEGEVEGGLVPAFHRRVHLAAGVAGGLLHLLQHRFDLFVHRQSRFLLRGSYMVTAAFLPPHKGIITHLIMYHFSRVWSMVLGWKLCLSGPVSALGRPGVSFRRADVSFVHFAFHPAPDYAILTSVVISKAL